MNCLSPQHYDEVYIMAETVKSRCSIHPDSSDLIPESWGGAQATVTLTKDIHYVWLPQPCYDLGIKGALLQSGFCHTA